MIRWLGIFLLLWFVYTVRSVFPPFIIGGIIAYLLLPVVQTLSSALKLRTAYAVVIVYLAVVLVCGLLAYFLMPMLIEQSESLILHRAEIIQRLVQQAAATFRWNLDVPQASSALLASIESNIGKPQEIVHLGGLLSKGLLEILVCVVSSLYFTADSKRVLDFCLRFVPFDKRATVANLSGQMNRMLSRYVSGQLKLIVIMSTAACIFLHYVIHMRYAVLIGIASGFLEIIPVLGPILATTTATLVGFSQYGASAAIYIIIFYTLARWLEDYVIVPKIIGHAVELHPLVIIFAVLCGEVMAGALGMLIAIPVAASIKVIIDFVRPEATQDS